MVLTTVIHRRQDGDPLVYAQRHVRLQGYLSSKVVQKKTESWHLTLEDTAMFISEATEKISNHLVKES